ncbi:MAG: molybdopterin molybdenumtransferase MoeA [Prosthecochloris sp.]|uniref:Molybdopterin molybdenumtransferase n=1 Tax=Chlorobium phaeobacteroides (strain BS1) TaxID=331678 RepID=B3EPM2_CHLPB|nr:molybdopterin molybdotransferase MoeA [Chlorobium phaeobacteroides]NEX14442.1 molybdopterin molybdenumtransferase MoeA [Prosthecochloris sp.]
MTGVREAHEIIAAAICELPVETMPLETVQGQVLAEEIVAGFALPGFDNAAMDGFAVQWADIQEASGDNPVTLRVLEEISAGNMPRETVSSGCCAQIMTGAPMPEGADTVVMFENTSGFGGSEVAVFKAPEFRANVRYAGEEVPEGELLLSRGVRLTPAEIGVLAAFGRKEVQVYRRPKVAIVTVGDELRLPGEQLEGSSIYNSNRYSLAACVASSGATIAGLWQVPDDPRAIGKALDEALGSCDLLITAGGISTGEYDYMQRLLTDLGVEQKFWKVAQKPGKPFFFGRRKEGAVVFGLPGNPVSSLVCFLEYCMPTLSVMQNSRYHGKIEAELFERFPADKKRYRFLFGRIWQKEGRLFCNATRKIESHMITSLAGANCLIEAPPSGRFLSPGTVVTCNLLPWSSLHDPS